MTTKNQPKQIPSQLDELQDASRWLANFGHIDNDVLEWTAEDIAEEMTRAMAPLQYLRTATFEFQEDLNSDMVRGYLDMFFVHMEGIKRNLHRLAQKSDQKDQAA